jgi:DeoR/GlpR family transcriptional regulator of sugar metabolism
MSNIVQERQKKCLEYVEAHQYTTIDDLVEFLQVSPVTIRRDIDVLNRQNRITRVYGGVVPYHTPIDPAKNPGIENSLRLNMNVEEKKLLARKAAELVKDRQSVFIDAGSSCYYIARFLSEKKIMVVTHSLIVVNFLKQSPNIRLITLGGEYYPNLEAFIGLGDMALLQNIALDIAFIGTASFDINKGCFNEIHSEKEIKNKVNSCAKESYIVFDSTKAKASSPFLSISIDNVKNIITSSQMEDKINFTETLRKKNINMLFA